MKFNTTAVAFWVFGSAIGYAVHGSIGLAIGLAVTAGISFLADVLS